MTEAATTSSVDSGFRVIANGQAVPLAIEQGCNTDNRTRYAHCAQALRSGLPALVAAGPTVTDKPCVIVGTGFSAIALLPEIQARYKAGEEIIAVKGAHDWLLENGVIPTAAVAMDAQRARAKCFKRPRDGILYLCASQMHPATWQHMRGKRVLIWHSQIDAEQRARPEWINAFLVPSASCTGNSAILLMSTLGRLNIHTYGFDACMPRPAGMIDSLRPVTKLDGTRARIGKKVFEVVEGGRSYWTTAEMVMQAQELADMVKMLDGSSITAYGDGLYQARMKTLVGGPAAQRFTTSAVQWDYKPRYKRVGGA